MAQIEYAKGKFVDPMAKTPLEILDTAIAAYESGELKWIIMHLLEKTDDGQVCGCALGAVLYGGLGYIEDMEMDGYIGRYDMLRQANLRYVVLALQATIDGQHLPMSYSDGQVYSHNDNYVHSTADAIAWFKRARVYLEVNLDSLMSI